MIARAAGTAPNTTAKKTFATIATVTATMRETRVSMSGAKNSCVSSTR